MEVEMNVPGVHHYQHHQEITSQTLESMLVCTKPQEDKKPKPPEEPLKCPRCDSSNTKFCYYNNYSLTQPRYFCKSCRRYWTKGGTLRNVPVGGGCRKNRRSSSATPSVTSAVTSPNSSCYAISKTRGPLDHHQLMQQQQNPLNLLTHNSSNNHLLAGLPHLSYDSSSTDLSLAFARLQNQANGSMGYDHFDHVEHHLGSSGNVDPLGFLGFLENRNTNTNTNTNMNMGNQFYHNQNVMYNNVGNDDDQEQQQMLNPMTTVKQEACNTGLWGYQGSMAHEVESGRSMIGGWNGIIGSSNWHGLINSPLM